MRNPCLHSAGTGEWLMEKHGTNVRRPLYQTPYPLTVLAQVRRVMEARRWGMFISVFHASQQASTMAL